jgi:hypothetical protein
MSEPTLYDLYRSKKLPKEMQKQLDKIYEESISHDLGLFMVGYHIRGMAASYTEEELKGQKMTKDEMKNRISLALKDPILQQGFEIICKENAEQKDEVKKLKLLVSSLVYEINQIWNINEMNDDLRRCAEKIDREVQLSKMAEDNRMVISALGFAIVPPTPKLDVKEI